MWGGAKKNTIFCFIHPLHGPNACDIASDIGRTELIDGDYYLIFDDKDVVASNY